MSRLRSVRRAPAVFDCALFEHGLELVHGVGDQALLERRIFSALVRSLGNKLSFKKAKQFHLVHSGLVGTICHCRFVILAQNLCDCNGVSGIRCPVARMA